MEEQENWCAYWCGCNWEIYLHYVILQEENYCDCHGFRGWPRFLRNAARRSDEIIVVNPACTEDFTTICIVACCAVIQFPYARVLLHVGLCPIFLSTWNWPKCWVKPVYVIYTLLDKEEFMILGSIPLFAESP